MTNDMACIVYIVYCIHDHDTTQVTQPTINKTLNVVIKLNITCKFVQLK